MALQKLEDMNLSPSELNYHINNSERGEENAWKIMKKLHKDAKKGKYNPNPTLTCLFADIAGQLLTNGWTVEEVKEMLEDEITNFIEDKVFETGEAA